MSEADERQEQEIPKIELYANGRVVYSSGWTSYAAMHVLRAELLIQEEIFKRSFFEREQAGEGESRAE